ncbi:MAG: tetratricopeptide repeat protein, partial [Methanospirillum sp.]|nr:tetratricopeptide repeat protein [Methanospirillum sp.]
MVLAILLLMATTFVLCPVVPAQNIQDATVWINKGKDAFQKKDYVSAIAAYDQALLLDEYYTEGWKLRGDA